MAIYISATQIHDGHQFLPANTIINVSEDGTILGILTKDDLPECVTIKHYEGIICPGFVNAHCHLELSHLKGVLPEATGLVDFVLNIPKYRFIANETEINEAVTLASEAMAEKGIVAVGDIANSSNTLHLLANLPFHLQTFVEAMGVVPEAATKRLVQAASIFDQFEQFKIQANRFQHNVTLVPHAPYSVSKALLAKIIDANTTNGIISIHNQESEAEILLFKQQATPFKKLYDALGVAMADLDIQGASSLAYVLHHANKGSKWLLVHNTFTAQEDIDYLKQLDINVFFCLCPNANWYIERQLPNIPLLMASNYPICLGTDSLASNYDLSIGAEILRIMEHYPNIAIADMLHWATFNGAKALGLDDVIGDLSIGKQPGITLWSSDNSFLKIL